MPSVPFGSILIGPSDERFEITDFLGNGAFGEVYRAVGKSSGTVVAVKLIPLSTLPSHDSKIALLNEIRTAQEVEHPNVVRILHVNDGTSSSVGPYVFMEYVSGGNLAELLRNLTATKAEIPLSRAIEMMIDIAQGARAINAKVIHRDIKPDNILIAENRLKIGDFGISKFVDESTRSKTFKGGQHIAYMAPEGWLYQANTFKIDVYSVGLVYYQILTMKHALVEKVTDPGNFLEWEKAHLYEQCPDVRSVRKDVPIGIAQLMNRMVSKRPQDRPPWDDVLKILSEPSSNGSGSVPHPSVSAAVESAIARQQQGEAIHLATLQKQSEHERGVKLYGHSCETLLESLKPIIQQFNQQFQHGQITYDKQWMANVYNIPTGHNISISFFEPQRSGIKIRGGEIIGGGWIGIDAGRSANLVLLRHGNDDLYGKWIVCEIGIMAMADPRKLIGRFGVTTNTVLPFGFRDSDFYDQMRYATGITHVFTYNFIDDVVDFFAQLLHEAVK
jgi:eukaryotic-like serine/threonine-protein kinase